MSHSLYNGSVQNCQTKKGKKRTNCYCYFDLCNWGWPLECFKEDGDDEQCAGNHYVCKYVKDGKGRKAKGCVASPKKDELSTNVSGHALNYIYSTARN